MVSLWPWRVEDTSPASFEKALSALATKITESQAHLDSLRSNNRRFKALWTLYSSFAYLLCSIILFLVVGWQNWSAVEYTVLLGSPLIIYLVRTALSTYYTYRIDSATHRLEDQQSSRAKTIDKLKAATKYDSTQELLEKYGGAPPKPKKENRLPVKSPKGPKLQTPVRVGTGPPPATANIARPGQSPSQPSTPQPQLQAQNPSAANQNPPMHMLPSPPRQQGQRMQPDAPGFAPNAFSSAPQYAQGGDLSVDGKWYDRVLDLLMGEDENSPKNRIALICQHCRLVNGQAPPGTKSLTDLGKWRCLGCGALNGEEDEAMKVVKEMKERIEIQSSPLAKLEGGSVEKESSDDGADEGQVAADDADEGQVAADDADEGQVAADDADEGQVAADDVAEDIDSTEDAIEVKPKRDKSKSNRKKA